jgi:hypothetical protein
MVKTIYSQKIQHMCKMFNGESHSARHHVQHTKNKRATAAFKAQTHISRGIDDTTVCILFFSSLILQTFLLYTHSFNIPHNQKSQGVKSGQCGGHWIGPP